MSAGGRGSLADRLMAALVEYGTDCDPRKIHGVGALYREAVRQLSEPARLAMLVELADHFAERRLAAYATYPFMLFDPSHQVVSSAALVAAPCWPGTTEDDPLHGVRALLETARVQVDQGDQRCAVAIVAGLLHLGDRRVTDALRGCWSVFTGEGRAQLSRVTTPLVQAPIVDWRLDWLQDSDDAEFGLVAGTLGREAASARAEGVVELRRALPIWSAPVEEQVIVVAEWSFPAFADRIRPRLEAIAQGEGEPRVMPMVLRLWDPGQAWPGNGGNT